MPSLENWEWASVHCWRAEESKHFRTFRNTHNLTDIGRSPSHAHTVYIYIYTNFRINSQGLACFRSPNIPTLLIHPVSKLTYMYMLESTMYVHVRETATRLHLHVHVHVHVCVSSYSSVDWLPSTVLL